MKKVVFHIWALIMVAIMISPPLKGVEIYYSGEESSTGKLKVTGIGYPPQYALGTPKGKLLARRSAIVDGYRKVLQAINDIPEGCIVKDGIVKADGYIKGVEIIEIKYFPSGKVEVILEYPLRIKEKEKLKLTDNCIIYVKEKGPFEISRDEWIHIIEERREK